MIDFFPVSELIDCGRDDGEGRLVVGEGEERTEDGLFHGGDGFVAGGGGVAGGGSDRRRRFALFVNF